MLKVFILVSNNPLFHPDIIHAIATCPRYEVCGVGFVTKKKKMIGTLKQLKQSIRVYGLLGSIAIAFQVCVKLLASIVPFRHVRMMASIKNVCKAFEIPAERVTNVNDPSFLARLSETNPDIVLSVQHQIFRSELLNIPRICCLNFHPAKLPSYRGVMPIFWAMFHNEKEIGLTVHSMTEKIDEGHIVAQEVLSLRRDHSLLQNYASAYAAAGPLMIRALDRLQQDNGRLVDYPTVQPGSPYYRMPTAKDVRVFRSRGQRIV